MNRSGFIPESIVHSVLRIPVTNSDWYFLVLALVLVLERVIEDENEDEDDGYPFRKAR